MGMAGGMILCAGGQIISSTGDFKFQKNSSGSFSFTFPTESTPIFVATPIEAYESARVIIGMEDTAGDLTLYTGYGDGYTDIYVSVSKGG